MAHTISHICFSADHLRFLLVIFFILYFINVYMLKYWFHFAAILLLSLGSAHGSHGNISFILENTVHLNKGTNDVALLSVTVGLPVLPISISLFLSSNFNTF